MYKYIYTTLFLFCCIYSNAQTRDFPEFPSPQQDFYKLLDEDKVMNPRYLEGNVKEVNRTYIQHISPDNEETYTANYFYRLKKDKEITEYTTNDMYDDFTLSYLNEALPPTIQHDTIINEDDYYTYSYQKGKLTNYWMLDIEAGTRDSIVYTYNNDNLHTRIEYQSQGAVEIEFLENGDIDDSTIYFTEFSAYAYSEATYTNTGQIHTLKEYRFTPELDFIDRYEYSYTYDLKGRFESMKVVSDRYFLSSKQYTEDSKKWMFEDHKSVEGMYQETTIHTTYDSQNRIQTYLKTDSQKNKESYHITYGEGSDKAIVVSRDDYNIYNNTLVHRDLVYEYTYDTHHNPIHIASYIIVNGKKILDKSTELKITYY